LNTGLAVMLEYSWHEVEAFSSCYKHHNRHISGSFISLAVISEDQSSNSSAAIVLFYTLLQRLKQRNVFI
jgi:hypothetical protein